MVEIPSVPHFYPDTFERAQISPVQASISADRARLERLSKEVKEITTLYNMAVTVGSSLNLREAIWSLYKESRRLINTANFAVIIYDDRTDILNFALVFDRGQPLKPFSVRRSDHQGLPTCVLATQAPLLVEDCLETDDITNIDPTGLASQDKPANQPVRSWLGVPILNPILSDENVQGVIATWSYQPHAFTDHELWLLSALGTQAAIAIRNARLYESVLAERDRVLEAQEQTRKALARDLHDGPTQLVSALMMHLDLCKMILEKDPTGLAKEIVTAQELARQAVHQMRTLLFELRPLTLEMQGLTAAIQGFIERRQTDIPEATRLALKIKTDQSTGEISRQDEKVEAALFAIVREAVNNAIKHAQAGNIVVELGETSTAIYTIITDDGNGFDLDQVMNNYEQRGSLGMLNLRERAELIGGELTLQSVPDQGTRIAVWVPKTKAERLKKRDATGPLRVRRDGRPPGF